MSTDRANDLRAFKGFLKEKLSDGNVDLTPEEALVPWEIENQTIDEGEETLTAIRRGFADIEAGRLLPACEALEQLRRKHALPPLA